MAPGRVERIDPQDQLAPAISALGERRRDGRARASLTSGATASSRSKISPSAGRLRPFPVPAGSSRA